MNAEQRTLDQDKTLYSAMLMTYWILPLQNRNNSGFANTWKHRLEQK